MLDHRQLQVNAIFNLMDKIEDKAGEMIQDIPELYHALLMWQEGKTKNSYFKETLNKYWDSIN